MGEGDEENSSDVYDIGVVSAAPAYERQPQLMERGLYKPEARYDGVQLLNNSNKLNKRCYQIILHEEYNMKYHNYY